MYKRQSLWGAVHGLCAWGVFVLVRDPDIVGFMLSGMIIVGVMTVDTVFALTARSTLKGQRK